MIFRSDEAKRDLVKSWNRPDRPFFAAGACHILAGVFLRSSLKSGFQALFIEPETGFRGGHVLVSNGETVFDYQGYSKQEDFLAHFFLKIRRHFPRWQGVVHRLEDSPMEEPFCREYQYRRPDQYLHDPIPRALAYLQRFEKSDQLLTVGTFPE